MMMIKKREILPKINDMCELVWLSMNTIIDHNFAAIVVMSRDTFILVIHFAELESECCFAV